MHKSRKILKISDEHRSTPNTNTRSNILPRAATNLYNKYTLLLRTAKTRGPIIANKLKDYDENLRPH
jgi:hypothetical protein